MHGTYIKEGLGLSFDEAVAKGSDILSKAGPALQAAGKSFELQVGPDRGHTALSTERMMEFFIENLVMREPAAAASAR